MTEAATEAATRRGRPRPAETIDRDEKVFAALRDGGPKTKSQLADATGLTGNAVYLSLFRLSRDGRIERGAEGDQRHVWRVKADVAA